MLQIVLHSSALLALGSAACVVQTYSRELVSESSESLSGKY